MGFRSLHRVIDKEGTERIRQYNQWGADPEEDGLGILNYLLTGDLNKYQENLSKINEITNSQWDEVEKDPKLYPYLGRNVRCALHQMIEDGKVKFARFFSDDSKEVDIWIEGFYTIDFQKRIYSGSCYSFNKTYSLDDLPTIKQYKKDIILSITNN